jgi:hypothetical protein
MLSRPVSTRTVSSMNVREDAVQISFDGVKTYPSKRVYRQTSREGPKGGMNDPDGFTRADRVWPHFAVGLNRHRAVSMPLPRPVGS